MKKLFFILFIAVSNSLWSQSDELFENKVDSLKKIIHSNQSDTIKVNAYFAWKDLFTSSQKDDEMVVNNEVLKFINRKLSSKLSKADKKFYQNKKIRILSFSGTYYLVKGEFSKANHNYTEALKIGEQLNNKTEIANANNNIGLVHIYQGNYPAGLKFSLKALRIREELNDSLNLAASYNNVAYLYMVLNNYDKSLDYNFKALKIYEGLKIETEVAGIYMNLGILYRNKKDYDKAIEYYLKALPVKEKDDNEITLADLYNNISVAYLSKGDFKLALDYSRKGLELHQKNDNKPGIGYSLSNLASAYLKLNNFIKARECFTKSLEIAKEINQKVTIYNDYLSLSRIDSALGNYSSSLINYKNYIIYRDSLYNEENTKNAVKAEMQFEFAKKAAKDSIENANQKQMDKAKIDKQNAELDKQEAEIRAKRFQQFLMFGGLGMVLVFAGFMYNRFRVTSQQKKIIEKQKHEVEHQKELVDEKNKEITDSINYAKRLQDAILPSEKTWFSDLPNSFILYQPKDIVAGDFYFMEKVGSYLFIAAADCTGHGVPGAMVSVVCSNALTRAVKEFGLIETGKILDKTRELVIETFSKSESNVKDGMDISLVRIDLNRTGLIQWSGANNPLVYFSENRIHELKPDKQPIGYSFELKNFTSHDVQLSKNDCFYIFTDGYADQFGGEKRKKFKTSKMKELFISIVDQPMNNQRNILNESFENWRGHLEQIDDVCVIGVRI